MKSIHRLKADGGDSDPSTDVRVHHQYKCRKGEISRNECDMENAFEWKSKILIRFVLHLNFSSV